MDDLMPPSIASEVNCFVLNEDSLAKKENVEITVCVKGGKLIEFYNKTIVNSCHIQCSHPTSITTFYAYKPSVKFYIIQECSKLVVVQRKDFLKEFKTLLNVSKFETGDFLVCGFPQARIWFEDEKVPLLTDFTSIWPFNEDVTDCSPRFHSELFLTLNKKLQEMKLCLEEATKLNNEKQKCRTRALFQFASNLNKGLLSDKDCEDGELEELEFLRSPTTTGMLLKLEPSWQKVVENWWIVCLPVYNTSDTVAKELDLNLLGTTQNMTFKTQIFVVQNTEPDSSSLFYKSTSVAPHSNAFVVGVMEIPSFKTVDTCSVSGILLYNCTNGSNEGYHQIHFPPFTLSTTDLLNGKLSPCSGGLFSVEDIVSIISVSNEFLLDIKIDGHLVQLRNLLLEKLQFSEFRFTDTCYCYVFQFSNVKALSGFLLFERQISCTSWLIRCYARDEKQLLLFAHSLLGVLPSRSYVTLKPKFETSLNKAVNALSMELNFLADGLKVGLAPSLGPLSDEAELVFTGGTWRELRKSHMQLELQTDLLFQGLS